MFTHRDVLVKHSVGAGSEEWLWFCPKPQGLELSPKVWQCLAEMLSFLWIYDWCRPQVWFLNLYLWVKTWLSWGQDVSPCVPEWWESHHWCCTAEENGFHLFTPQKSSMVCQSTWRDGTVFYSRWLSQLLAQCLACSRSFRNEEHVNGCVCSKCIPNFRISGVTFLDPGELYSPSVWFCFWNGDKAGKNGLSVPHRCIQTRCGIN